ncbi:MAG: N-acetyl-gamma-glutamyl-phosphate reductase [Thermodesulfobacteriota bacterium]
MIRAGIVGATGYAGAEVVRILSGHPEVKIKALTSSQYVGMPFDAVYPSMTGFVNLTCTEYILEEITETCDIVFVSLPHKLPMQIVPGLLGKGKRVIDLSADFRFKNPAAYESVYQEHSAKELLQDAVYGLCEIYADSIRGSTLIGNPGCYPTSALLPLIPLVREKLLDMTSIIVDSKSGVSGAGRSPSLKTHSCETAESFKAYNVGRHRHAPEMEEVLSTESGKPVRITFVPHLIPMSRGMFSTIYASTAEGVSSGAVRSCLTDYYRDKPFIRLRFDESQPPDTLHVRGTNYCDIGFKPDPERGRIILLSAIDNLVKGAAGQAVQCMNLMMGFKETDGLIHVPYPI